jgi:hypothetical protein
LLLFWFASAFFSMGMSTLLLRKIWLETL